MIARIVSSSGDGGPVLDRRGELLLEQLALVQVGIQAAGSDELGVVPRSTIRPVIEHQDQVGLLDRPRSGASEEDRATDEQLTEVAQDLLLRVRVDRREAVVEQKDARLEQQRPGQRTRCFCPPRG